MTSIEGKLVNSRAPDIRSDLFTQVFTRGLSFPSQRRDNLPARVRGWPLGTNQHSCNQTCLDNGDSGSIAARLLVDHFPMVRHLKCTVKAVYIKSFGGQKGGGGGVRANPLEPPLPTGLIMPDTHGENYPNY